MSRTIINKLTIIYFSISILTAITLPKAQAKTDDGGYPWANASTINSQTFDWGYIRCQKAMQRANTCRNGHIGYKFGISYYQSDPWHYDLRNCTSYVAWKVYTQYKVNIRGWGNARFWVNNASKSGFKTGTKPQIGAIAWWPGVYGHVAYVSKVNPDNTVEVEQYNSSGKGEYSRQNHVRAVKYIYIKPVASAHKSLRKKNISSVIAPVTATKLKNQIKLPKNTAKKPRMIKKLPNLGDPDKLKLFPKTNWVNYSVNLNPASSQLNAYAVQYNYTKSGNIEINISDPKTNNTSWSKSWSTNLKISNQYSSFLIADFDKDNIQDLVISEKIQSNSPQNLYIIYGKDNYQHYKKLKLPKDKSLDRLDQISVTDFNFDGQVDIVAYRPQANKLELKVFDGSSDFQQAISQSIELPKAMNNNATESELILTDHNQDQKLDVMQITDLDDGSTKVNVLDSDNQRFEWTLDSVKITDHKLVT